MSINLDIRDPLVEGRLPARYLGYARYKCSGCQKPTTHVIVTEKRGRWDRQYCQRCYWSKPHLHRKPIAA